MSMLVNSFLAAVAAAGIQYVGGYQLDATTLSNSSDYTFSLAGVLTGGIASSPVAGDYCVIFYSQSGTADRSNRAIYNAVGAFTQLATQYANDTNDTSVTLAAKFLESPINYDVTIGNASSSANGIVASVHVLRGVNVTTPLDVAVVVNSTINTGQPDPSSITPITTGAKILVFGAAAFGASLSAPFTSSDFDIFGSVGISAAGRSHASGFGYKSWTSGAFNAAQFGGGEVSLADSAIAISMAVRPA